MLRVRVIAARFRLRPLGSRAVDSWAQGRRYWSHGRYRAGLKGNGVFSSQLP